MLHITYANLVFAGEELTQLEQKRQSTIKSANQAETPSIGLQCYGRQFLIVRNGSDPSRLIGRICNEEQALPRYYG